MSLRRVLFSSAVIALLLSGCGFHLRGVQDVAQLPFDSLYVQPVGDFTFDHDLKRVLASRGGVKLSDSAEGAPYQLGGLGEGRSKTLRSIDINGKAKEYLLRYDLNYRVENKLRVTVKSGTLSLTRTMTYSDNELAGKDLEEQKLYEDMRQDAFFQLLHILGALPAPTVNTAQ
ncbi:LPS assembly lipoprotein LptE [Leeia sp. TBRC 13508]|uniref:LPS-assembly lipoprotein LptE n=1 Tax=Leeia speluncae TaxID=2884804 RepID=A0ABS8D7F3_9NEIS|nr:LPS assembly lipoprotein LptE [Leeia speluncae]MCB6184077.1 LPS assembly lipoprotein LptE [Leeia speluncae]